jgi:hypothetical protein
LTALISAKTGIGTDGGDGRVGDELDPDGRAVGVDHREHPGREPAGGDGAGDRGRDDLRGAGVGVVRLDHHRAAGRQGGGGVAPGDGEGEREVAGGEHRDRPDGNAARPDVGPPGGLAVGQRVVDARPVPAALPQRRREQPELPGGPPDLAGQPGQGQAGLAVGALGRLRADRVDLVGGELEQARALLDGGGPEGLERGLGQFGRAGDELAVGELETGLKRGAVGRVDGVEGPGVTDDRLSGDVHGADDGCACGCHVVPPRLPSGWRLPC